MYDILNNLNLLKSDLLIYFCQFGMKMTLTRWWLVIKWTCICCWVCFCWVFLL